MQYVIDRSKLQAFDIVLTREKSKRSKAIRGISVGDYSHALICLDSSSLIEATIEGRVFTENAQRLIFDKIEDCKVLRFKNTLTKDQKEKMNYFLRTQIGNRYSIKEAIKIPLFSRTMKTADDGQFCSRLVAQAYQCASINLVTNPNYCTPENLNSSEFLNNVPNVVRIATSEDIEICERPSQIKENQIQTYIWLDKVAELAKKENFKIHTQSDVGSFLLKYPSYDEEVCTYIRETTYLKQYKQDEIIHPFRYKFDSRGTVNIAQEFNMNSSVIERHLSNYLACKKNYESTNLCYFSMLKDLYANMLKQCYQRLDVLEEYIKIDTKLSNDADYTHYLSNILIEIKQLQIRVKSTLGEY